MVRGLRPGLQQGEGAGVVSRVFAGWSGWFHESSTRVPPGFHQVLQWLRGGAGGLR